MNAPGLASFCCQGCKKEVTGSFAEDWRSIHIQDTSPEVFRLILRYIYGGGLPAISDRVKMGKDLIDTANRYGLVDLKEEAEYSLVESLVVNMHNVVDWILFADAKMCALLKEYAASSLHHG